MRVKGRQESWANDPCGLGWLSLGARFLGRGREVSAKTFSSFGMDFGADGLVRGKSVSGQRWVRTRISIFRSLAQAAPVRIAARRLCTLVFGGALAIPVEVPRPRQLFNAPSPRSSLDIRGTPRGWVSDRRADGSGDQSVRGNESALAHEAGRASAGSR